MLSTAKNLITGVVETVTGADPKRKAAAKKAASTRKRAAAKRSEAAKKAAESRKRNARARSAAAKKGAKTRGQRRARVDAMLDAVRRD